MESKKGVRWGTPLTENSVHFEGYASDKIKSQVTE